MIARCSVKFKPKTQKSLDIPSACIHELSREAPCVPPGRKIAMRRVALVTGGGRGIGAEICRVLANAGLQVVAADIDVGAARSTAASLGGEGHVGHHVDVADEESVEGLFEAVERDT